MKRKKMASKLLSLILSAAVIVSSSFGGVTLMDVGASQVLTQETVSDNTVEDVDVVDVQEPVEEEAQAPVEEPEVGETAEVVEEPLTVDEGSAIQPPNSLKTVDVEEEEEEIPSVFEPAKSGYRDAKLSADLTAEEVFDGVGDGSQTEDVISVEKVTTIPNDADLATSFMPSQLANVLLKIYNTDYAEGNTCTIGNFTYAQIKEMDGVVDLETVAEAAALSSAAGLGYLSNATEISICGTGITTIPANEFTGHEYLETIVLPDSITGIGEGAFASCKKLSAINVKTTNSVLVNTLPSQLDDDKMGSGVFLGCESLTAITIPSFTETAALQKATGIFQGCKNLTSVTISANVSVIPSSAFKNAGSETDGMTVAIAAGSQLETIMDSAFQYCNMEQIDLSNCSKLARIGVRCFTSEDDTSKDKTTACKLPLTTLVLPNGTTASTGLLIEDEAFFKTPIATICVGTYDDSKEGILMIPDYVKKIGVAAFYGNKAATSVVLSANLPRIEAYTFKNCTALTSVTQSTLGGDCLVTSIGTQAFYGTELLENADFLQNMVRLNYIGDDVYDIKNTDQLIYTADYFEYKSGKLSSSRLYGSDVFSGSGITSAVFPASLRAVNSHAFANATNLVQVTWKSDALIAMGSRYDIGTDAFSGCTALTDFVYPETLGKGVIFVIGARAFWCDTALVRINKVATTGDGSANVLPTTLTELKLGAFAGCSALQYIAIHNNESGACPAINNGVFAECSMLTTAVLPAAMAIVPQDMFYDCGLTSFPSFGLGTELTRIEDGAFFGNKMTTVDLSGFTKLNYIGPVAFAYWDIYHKESTKTLTVVSDEVIDDTSAASLKTVILPNAITGAANMAWDNNVFQGACNLTTVATPAHNVQGEAFIPNYVLQSSVGIAVFASTGISKAYWGYADVATGANAWTEIPKGMFAFTKVTDLTKCCIPAGYLVKIGDMAYAGTQITALDLSVYPLLAETGAGAFSNCNKLASIKLPSNGLYTKVGDYTFICGNFTNTSGVVWFTDEFTPASSLTTVDYGTVQKIGKYAFASIDDDGRMGGNNYTDVMASVDLSSSFVTEIGAHAYAGNTALQTIKLDGVLTVGEAAFRDCTSLKLTETPLADSIQMIGKHAFYRDHSLGKVSFGSKLQEIGESAFAETAVIEDNVMTEGTGVTSLDFTNAKELVTIGKNAFLKSALVYVDMTPAPVTKLLTGVLSDCPYLRNIVIGDSVRRVEPNAVYGCIGLLGFTFCSTTTVAEQAFAQNGSFVSESGTKYTPVEDVIFTIKTADLNVGIGNKMVFPFYINDVNNKNLTGEFGEIIIGQADVTGTDDTIHQYLKVMANTSKYYRNEAKAANIIEDPTYFEQTGITKYKVNDTEVYAFEVLGLQPTPAGKSIPFSVTTKYSFAAGGKSTTKDITAKYNLKVLNVSYYPVLYTESSRTKRFLDMNIDATTGMTAGLSDVRVGKENTSGKMTLWYNISTVENTNWRPANGNLIIQSSNPDVVKFGGNGVKEVDVSTWKLTAEQTTSTGNNMTTITNGKTLVMTPVSQGTAVVVIYHESCPDKKIIWNINVNVDIKRVALSIPSEYKGGVYEGDKFQIIEKIEFYLGKPVERAKGTIEEYKKYTDNRLYCASSNPEYYSINEYGYVTILKSSATKVPTLFVVLYGIPNGEMTKSESAFDIVYPEFKVGGAAKTSNGESVKIVEKPTGKSKYGKVIYTGAKEGATSVTVPATVTVGGVKCKVTGIGEGAFENNTTMTSLTIAKGIKEIPANMCKGCTKLTKVTLPATVTSIGDAAFQGCSALTKITIPKKVKTIGNKAFYNCKKLKTVSVNANAKLQTIGNSAFANCSVLPKITIPKNVKTIGSKAFSNCKKLKKITVKSKVVTKVGKNAFKGIQSKAVIDVPNNKLGSYKTLFKKGQGKKVKIK